MKCIDLIYSVLSEVYMQIPGSDAEKDRQIKLELENLSRQYRNLTKKGCLDYKNPVTRFAYIYRYVTMHANIVHQLIGKINVLQNILLQEKVTVACIGGGPGSDFVGIMKYLSENENKVDFLRILTFDRESSWAESWSDVEEKVSAEFRLSTIYQSFDVLKKETWAHQEKHLSADLFTLIFFMSELFAHKDEAQEYFSHLFRRARKGALFLFVDNNSQRLDCGSWFDDLCQKNNLKIIENRAERLILSGEEQKKDLKIFYEKFDSIRLTADAAWKVALKE